MVGGEAALEIRVLAKHGLSERTSKAINKGMFLGLLPPSPPVAQRCAFTWALLSSSSAGGPPVAASAWKSLAQMPLPAPPHEAVVQRLA
jgi:hypothetical protein